MTTIFYSPKSREDLDEIWEYIALSLGSPIAAQNTVSGILNTVDALDTNPQMGTPLYFWDGLFSGYRYLLYKNYMAFYRYRDGAVYVDRILYAKSDYMKKLFPEQN